MPETGKCGTCEHWGHWPPGPGPQRHGYCKVMTGYTWVRLAYIAARPRDYMDPDTPVLVTRAEFGCVRWEARREHE